jgi:hypothetical protein
VLHIVPPQQDELALPVEVVDVHDAEARLAGAPTVLARQHQPGAAEAAQYQSEQGHEPEDDHEGDRVLDRRRGFDPKSRQHDELSTVVGAGPSGPGACLPLYHDGGGPGQRG